MSRQLSGFHPAAMELLAGLPWPGNIDDLAEELRLLVGSTDLQHQLVRAARAQVELQHDLVHNVAQLHQLHLDHTALTGTVREGAEP